MSFPDVIFLYTGATFWTFVSVFLAITTVLAVLGGLLRGFWKARKYASTYFVCKKLCVDRDIKYMYKIREAAQSLMCELNRTNGLHRRDLDSNDFIRLMGIVEKRIKQMEELNDQSAVP